MVQRRNGSFFIVEAPPKCIAIDDRKAIGEIGADKEVETGVILFSLVAESALLEQLGAFQRR